MADRSRTSLGSVILSASLFAMSAAATAAAYGSGTVRVAVPHPLRVSEARVPRAFPRLRVAGTYPQVSGVGPNLGRVNRVILSAIVNKERQLAPSTRVTNRLPAVFMTASAGRFVSASTTVVSVLLPTVELFPGGNDGTRWLAVTIRVATGREVGLRSLFDDPARGIAALARSARHRLTAANACVRRSVAKLEVVRDLVEV